MSWTCQHCNTVIDDESFDICWNCSCVKGRDKPLASASCGPPHCLRCQTNLTFIGTKNFHQGARWGILGDLGEAFVNKQELDMFACKSCGKVEFFIAGFIKSKQ
ncbi:hypothetical protein CW748_02910 [Alteromonadales bacterium alter-6D02]|nr:hypothetical protein CW748_02910 [Alteromonadales bacterium alter-6D02]